jgi:transposase-like protein/IS1 family transposase
MDSQTAFCPNPDCPARGQREKGNITIWSQKKRRYRCTVCQKTFTATKGTLAYRLHTDLNVVTLVVTLLAFGCPVQAIVFAFGFDERTVRRWQRVAGQHCQQVHAHLVEQPHELSQVQADEIRVKLQGQIVWLAMALQVSTRLWLGAVIGAHRDEALLTILMQKIRRCALCRPCLIAVDGWRAYRGAIQSVFREAVPSPHGGRPHLRPWDGICIAQVIKQYERGRVVGILRNIVQGTPSQIQGLLQRTQGGGVINTAFIERLNATFRARLAGLVRRTRSVLKQLPTLEHGVYLLGTIYNFCTPHASLAAPLYVGSHARIHWVKRTPAMAAGITDHCWTVKELMLYHVPLPRWTPPTARGRPSKHRKQLIQKWAP